MRRVDVLALTVAVGSLVSCSPAPGGGGGVGDNGGNGGANGGSVPIGGASGSAAGGAGGTILTGGTNNGGTGNVCDALTVQTRPVTPTVLILVDNSSSMFEPRADLWDALYNALMAADGPIAGLQSKIRFGFASYRGAPAVASGEDDPACATITSVPYGLDNYSAINTTYTQLGTEWMQGIKWETPTGHAIRRVIPELTAYVADPPGPKFILLVTDGNPNTCRQLDPQCGQDQTIKAVQEAFAANIGTFVLGIGDIVGANTGCVPAQMRCGVNHLQDIMNAGQGQPVIQPPAEYVYQPCVANAGGVLTATYSPTGGTLMPLTATNPAAIAPALQGLLNAFVSCTVDMDAIVTGDAARGTVTVTPSEGPATGQTRPIGNDNPTDGWTLESNKYQVTLTGQACEDFKLGAVVSVEFPCGVAEPR